MEPGVDSKVREEIFSKYLETPEGRSKLVTAAFGPASRCLEILTMDPTRVNEADSVIRTMEQVQARMSGEEECDRRKFSNLLEGLTELQKEIRGQKVFKTL